MRFCAGESWDHFHIGINPKITEIQRCLPKAGEKLQFRIEKIVLGVTPDYEDDAWRQKNITPKRDDLRFATPSTDVTPLGITQSYNDPVFTINLSVECSLGMHRHQRLRV